MTKSEKDELMMKITRGERLSPDDDDLCYALFTPDEYAKIPDASRPPIPSLENSGDGAGESISTPTDSSDDLQQIKMIVKGIAAAISVKNRVNTVAGDDPVLIALQKAQHIFDTVDPIAWLRGQDYVEWMVAAQSVCAALDTYGAETATDRPQASKRGKPVRCVTDGIEYPSIATCAQAYGVPTTSISNHLAGRYGFATVHDRTFERIVAADDAKPA